MTRAYLLAHALERAGAEPEIVGGLAPGASIYPEPPENLRIVPIPQSTMLNRVIATRNVASGDILYAVKPRATSFGVALMCRGGRPVILDVDDWEAMFDAEPVGPSSGRAPLARVRYRARRFWHSVPNLGNPDHAFYSRRMQRFVPRADAVTANTRFLAQRFGAIYLPSGKDTRAFDPARFNPDQCRVELGLAGYRVIMFPGTVREHKGLEDVLHALDQLNWDDARLVLVGGRDVGDAPAESLARRWPRWVVRLPRYSMSTMPRVIAAAHVIVAPQHDTAVARAQFPMKLTDAMAMAKPIVSTRVGDIPEVLEGAAFLVAPSSPNEIATALRVVFEQPDRARRMGDEARRRCEARYSIDALGATLADVLATATARSRR
jgi:glycosyltransferase involved in cell wall biosynthesis